MLHEHAKKRALRDNYRTRGGFSQDHRLTGGDHRSLCGDDLSIFIHESTVESIAHFEEHLRVRQPEKWSSTKKLGKARLPTHIRTPRARAHTHTHTHTHARTRARARTHT